MWPRLLNSISRGIWAMGASVWSYVANISHLYLGQAYDAIETRQQDASGGNTIVKRFKRRHSPSHDYDMPNSFPAEQGQPTYFTWADHPADYIGHDILAGVRKYLEAQIVALERGSVTNLPCTTTAAEPLAGVPVAVALSKVMMQQVEQQQEDGLTPKEEFLKAMQDWHTSTLLLIKFIDILYLTTDFFHMVKKDYPIPPTKLCIIPPDSRLGYRECGQLLSTLISHSDDFGFKPQDQATLRKVMVDIDAAHKDELMPSWVKWPGRPTDGTPSSPLGEAKFVVTEIPAAQMIVEPWYDAKYPDPPFDQDTGGAALPGLKIMPRSILKYSRRWSEWRTLKRGLGFQSPRPKRLTFRNPVVQCHLPTRTPIVRQPRLFGREVKRRIDFLRAAYGRSTSQSPEHPSPSDSASDTLITVARADYDGSNDNPSVGDVRDDSTPKYNLDKFELGMASKKLNAKDSLDKVELGIASMKLDSIEIYDQLRDDMQYLARRKIEEEKERKRKEERKRAEAELRRVEGERRRREEEERCRVAEEQRRAHEYQRRRAGEERLRTTGLRSPKRPLIMAVPPRLEGLIRRAVVTSDDTQIVMNLDGQALHRPDFAVRLLPPTALLNDNIINGSLLYIADYANKKVGVTQQTADPKFVAFTSFFWPRLTSAGVGSVGRLMRKANVRKNNFLDVNTILIPICEGNHWTLVVIQPELRRVTHMDSMRGGVGRREYATKAMEWVRHVLAEKFVEAEWKIMDFEAPRQTNCYDCGVFVITNAMCMSLGLDPMASYSERQLPLQRRCIAAMLLNQGFKQEMDLGDI